ncbi:MAG: LAGLIDADG family homing endonuclease [Thermodesulfobacteriota bacterium]
MVKTPNVLEQPEYPNLPERENGSVGSISRDERDAAWLAGIIDGEGCISVSHNRNHNGDVAHYRPRFEIRNTNPYLMRRITEILTTWKVKYFLIYIKPREVQYRESLAMAITNYRGIMRILSKTMPYLTAKKEEAQAMMKFIKWRLCVHPMKGCNNGRNMSILRERFAMLSEELKALKQRRFSLQRLPRRTSGILDLSKVEIQEVMV